MSQKNALKDTLNLPQTRFPMQAQLVKREADRLRFWDEQNLYECIQRKNANGKPFVLHDGPPFTNGNVHIGTALNKILKDIILRYKSMCGFSAAYIPGWDCHGLPIEHKVSKEAPELLKDTLGIRKACDAFSEQFIKIQEKQFKRLGILADWQHPYKTKDSAYEAEVLRVFARFVRKHLVYRSKKPVYWSIPCKTALAEAEIEYKSHTSTSVWVKFRLKEPSKLELSDPTSLVIWTTTPWTLPANRAVAVSPTLDYIQVQGENESFIVAEGLAERFIQDCKLSKKSFGKKFSGTSLEGLLTQHPFMQNLSPVVLANYVTLDTGTGCVHTAPGHGMEDYLTGLKYKLDIYCPVDDEGRFINDGQIPPTLVGCAVHEGNQSPANREVLRLLEENRALLQKSSYKHAYPHCWRSKTPIIFRAIPQWFICLSDLKEKALHAIEKVQWIPAWGKNRIQGSVEGRPDWCISRQRTWGIPIPVFYDEAGNALLDADLIEGLADKISKKGTQWWFASQETDLLDGLTLPEAWRNRVLKKGKDTLDVWIDSGCSHHAVLKPKNQWPADLYLEGSDQHRGWFQSSLWTALIDGDEAPYRTVLTHGFFVDENRKKISKSDGTPQTAEHYLQTLGADILRLWVASEDYRNDIPVSESILQQVVTTYRTIRNSLRFQIGNLFDFDFGKNAQPIEKLSPIDQWALWETYTLCQEVSAAYDSYEFHKVYQAINQFCTVTLSSRYHDILKDRLYTFAPDWPERRSSQTALFLICNTLIRLLAPVLVFTSDEAFGYLQGNTDFGYKHSIHLDTFPVADERWNLHQVGLEMADLFKIREAVQFELEKMRQDKKIGQSLDAKVTLVIGQQDAKAALLQKYVNYLAEHFIVSAVHLSVVTQDQPLTVLVAHADGVRCPRTWRWVDELVEVEGFGWVSKRCKEALKNL